LNAGKHSTLGEVWIVSLGRRTSPDSEPQFGEPVAGVSYVDRPGVYALVFRGNLLLVIETPAGHYLPGGGIDAGESPEAALRRELLEETGLSVASMAEAGRAQQYVIDSATGTGYNKIETFFHVTPAAFQTSPVEPDHTSRWVPISEAIVGLREPVQAWAVRTLLSS
jgi:8-oxo-dGTP diphosphatase